VLGVAAPDEEGPGDEVVPAPVAGGLMPAPRVPLRTKLELLVLGALRRVAPSRAQPRLIAAAAWRAAQLPEPARPPWDRLVAIDPAAARGRPLWRLIAPPVDDRLFAPPRRLDHQAHVMVAAPSTAYREQLLTAAKHAHDVRHIAHGITPATLLDVLGQADVAVALRPHAGAGFEHDVAVHLAAGHLVICDELAHGLEPHIDAIEIADDRQLAHAVGAVRAAPDVHHRVRIRGRQKADRFRASRVWPELIADLLADLDAFDA
jgi:hypothetical protein